MKTPFAFLTMEIQMTRHLVFEYEEPTLSITIWTGFVPITRGSHNYRLENKSNSCKFWRVTIELETSGLPIKRLFLHGVDVADKQDAEEGNHRAKDHIARGFVFEHFLVDDCPRIHEHDFDVEKDEQHCHEVELDGHTRAAFPDGQHAALVGSILDFAGASTFAKDGREPDHSAGGCY